MLQTAGIIIIPLAIILVMAAVLFFTPAVFPSDEQGPVPTVTPADPVITVTPAIATPSPVPDAWTATGIWVRVMYNGSFAGDYGYPGNLKHVGGSGERCYRLPEGTRLVEVSFSKQDYGGENLTVEIYRDGAAITTRAVRAPMGSISFIIDAVTGEFPGGIPTPAPATGLAVGATYRI